MSEEDSLGVTRSMDDVRRAIEAVQEQLAAEQQTLMERDPLVAAKWYAKSADRQNQKTGSRGFITNMGRFDSQGGRGSFGAVSVDGFVVFIVPRSQ